MAMPKSKIPDKPNVTKTEFVTLQNKVAALELAYKSWQSDIIKSGKALSNSLNEKNVLKVHLEELIEARTNMRNNALIVSLNEFKNVNDNIGKISDYLKDIDIAVKGIMESLVQVTRYLKSCEKDLKVAKQELDDYGEIHDFRASKKKNK